MKVIGIIVIALALAAAPAMVASDVGTPDDKPRSQPMLNYTAKRITTPDWDQPENDPSPLWRATPRQAIHDSRRTIQAGERPVFAMASFAGQAGRFSFYW